MKEGIWTKYIGDKSFYRMVLAISVPIMIQNGISNFVSLLDNIMVGQVGTEQMTGVAVVNQLMLVFNLCVFGAVSGAGIFTAQFFGQENQKGIRDTLRFKLLSCVGLALIGVLLFFTAGENLISLYLSTDGSGADTAAALQYGKEYMMVAVFGMLPFAVIQAYAGTLRETGETILPMIGGIAAVFVNLVLDYIMIFGKLGCPAMGVKGAALATVAARLVEFLIVISWTHRHKEKNPYIEGLYRGLSIPLPLVKQIMVKGMPLMVNEALWSGGQAVIMQSYSVRGLSVVAGINISSTLANLFNVVFIALGNAIAIVIGRLLGSNKMQEARDRARKLIFFSVAASIVSAILMLGFSRLFPLIYNTDTEVKKLATGFIRVASVCMPLYAFMNASYFVVRSGGKTLITFLFDSVFVWVVSIPLAYLLSRYTVLDTGLVYFFCQAADIIKCVIGFILVKKGVWVQNVVDNVV